MFRVAYIRNLLILLLGIYLAQGSLYIQGSIISQLVFAAILGIAGMCFIYTLIFYADKGVFYFAWSILFLLNLLGFIFSGDLENTNHMSMFKGTSLTLLLFYPFYYFSVVNVLTSRHLIWFAIIMLPLSILRYYFEEARILSERISDKTDVVNNGAYFFLGLIPYLLLFRTKKIIAFLLMFVLMFFIIQSAKRGALIAGAVGLLGFIYFHLRTVSKRQKILSYFFVLMALVTIGFYVDYLYTSNPYLVQRMESLDEGGYSGRDIIYSSILNSWAQSDSFINFIFGYGYASSLQLSGLEQFAHNDWLELLSGFGLLGVVIYLTMFVSSFKTIISKTWKVEDRVLLATVMAILLLNTFVYRFYAAIDGFLYSIILGFLFGSYYRPHERGSLSIKN